MMKPRFQKCGNKSKTFKDKWESQDSSATENDSNGDDTDSSDEEPIDPAFITEISENDEEILQWYLPLSPSGMLHVQSDKKLGFY